MSEQLLRTGILGLGRRSHTLIEAITDLEAFDVIAVADRDLQRAEKIAARFECSPFDDYRQFIIQNELDCVIVAAGLHSCLEHVRQALKHSVPVLKVPPMARNFEEAMELSSLAQAQKTRFDIATLYRYCGSFSLCHSSLKEEPMIEKPFLIRVHREVGMLPEGSDTQWPIQPDHEMAWVTDEALAGGGVLLHDAYELFDQLVKIFGIPQQVYALCNSRTSDNQQLHHLTEDSALMVLRFAEGLMAEVVAMRHWDTREEIASLEVHDRERRVYTDPKYWRLSNSKGKALKSKRFKYTPVEVLSTLLEGYAQSLRNPEEHPYPSGHQRQLEVMAVMEAAYLSCRTGSPESPERFISMAR